MNADRKILNYIGGEWRASNANAYLDTAQSGNG